MIWFVCSSCSLEHIQSSSAERLLDATTTSSSSSPSQSEISSSEIESDNVNDPGARMAGNEGGEMLISDLFERIHRAPRTKYSQRPIKAQQHQLVITREASSS